MHKGRRPVVIAGELGRSNPCVGHPLGIGPQQTRDVLRLHLQRAIRVRRAAIEQLTRQPRVFDGVLRPKVGCEESDRPLEVPCVQEERPALIASGNGFPGSLFFWLSQRKRQVAIPEPLSPSSLLEVQSIGRPKDPRT